MKFATIAIAVFVGLGLATATGVGCSGPYSSKPSKLKKPRKKKRPDTAPPTAEAEGPVFDEKCRTNFFADPGRVRRKKAQSRGLTREADDILREVEGREGEALIAAVNDALGKLKNALRADPYGAEATYSMAAAYAVVGKKGCALALLQRLSDLTKMPAAEAAAERTINRALRDQRFEPFRKEADQALGR